MPRSDVEHGFSEVHLKSWSDFLRWVSDRMHPTHTIWRGQSSAAWSLETSFDRAVRTAGKSPTEGLARAHLGRFKRATRGRRTVGTRAGLSDEEWWTLGQHYGLATPMLDWTYSPFVALYFAFLDVVCTDAGGSRAVWALNMRRLNRLNSQANARRDFSTGRVDFIVLDPIVDENARLVNQNGLFTHGPIGITMDAWVRENADLADGITLAKVVIPDRGDREECLRHLNQMNINHVTLFPDLEGASRHCNHALTITDY